MPVHDSKLLPAHARVIANPDVWMEGDGVAQFAREAALPGCVRAVAMPDLHAGKGPVGATFAFRGAVHPRLLGGDVGCGVRVAVTAEVARNRDALERRVRRALDDDPLEGCAGPEVLARAWSEGPRGLAALAGADEVFAALAADEAGDPAGEAGDLAALGPGFEEALGTIGGGNHFVEISRVDDIRDPAAAEALGLERGRLVVVAHSGSRGLGSALARRYGDGSLGGAAADAYLADVAGACRFARANRFLLAYRMLRALGSARRSRIAGGFDVTHNDVRIEEVAGAAAWVHRKGAAPARAGEPTIVLGSRGAPSWVLLGTGAEDGLRSVAHGAGRKMGRSEARAKLKGRYARSELGTTKLGGRVLCDDADLLYEEHPDAYKPVDPVVRSLLDAGLARAVASLVPVVTVKR